MGDLSLNGFCSHANIDCKLQTFNSGKVKGVLSFAPGLAVMPKWIASCKLAIASIPMVKNILITTLLAFNAIIKFPIKGQSLTDREAIIQSLAGKNIDGKFRSAAKRSESKKIGERHNHE